MIYQIENSRFLRYEDPRSKGWASLVLTDPRGSQLWLGGVTSLIHEDLKAHNIHTGCSLTIITVNEGVQVEKHPLSGVRHLHFVVKDNPAQYDFTRGNQMIEDSLSRGNLLVHCGSGHSRSPALVLSYLMEKKGFTLKAAIDFLRSKRFEANPILSVKKALKNFEMVLNSPKHEELNMVYGGVSLPKVQKEPTFYEMKRRVLYKSITNKVIDEEFNRDNRQDLAKKEEFLFHKTLSSLAEPTKICGQTLQIQSSWLHKK